MGLIGYLETSVGNYHYLLRNNSEEHSSQLLRGGSLKSKQQFWFRHNDADILSMEA
jgi:hypothetical protein